MKFTHCLASVALVSVLGACGGVQNQVTDVKGPVDYVNPYMGNISLSPLSIYQTACSVFIRNGQITQRIC